MTESPLRISDLSDVSDPRLGAFRDLPGRAKQSSAGGTTDSTFVAEGFWLVERLVASPFSVESIVTTEAAADRVMALPELKAPVYVLPNATIQELTGFDFHRGVLACGKRRPSLKLETVAASSDQPRTFVLLPHIHDPANLGGIFRNCAAFGVDAVVLGDKCTDYLGRRVLRTSMGAALRVPVVQTNSMSQTIRRLQDAFGVQVVSTTIDADAKPLEQFQRMERTAVVFGPEDAGLSEELDAMCDERVTIAMREDTDSLNVAVTSGIVLHQLRNK